jgi:uncharacterized membrane protein
VKKYSRTSRKPIAWKLHKLHVFVRSSIYHPTTSPEQFSHLFSITYILTNHISYHTIQSLLTQVVNHHSFFLHPKLRVHSIIHSFLLLPRHFTQNFSLGAPHHPPWQFQKSFHLFLATRWWHSYSKALSFVVLEIHSTIHPFFLLLSMGYSIIIIFIYIIC